MKKILCILIFIIFSAVYYTSEYRYQVVAQTGPAVTKSNTLTPFPSDKMEKINSLKEKIATTVAGLRDKEEMLIWGNIEGAKTASFTLRTQKLNYDILFGEDIQIFEKSNGKLTTSTPEKSLVNENHVFAFGFKTGDDNTFTAKSIYKTVKYAQVSGIIKDIDKDSFYIILTDSVTEYKIDFEKLTKNYIISAEGKKTDGGFSKLTQGDKIMIYGEIEKDEKNNLTASKTYLIKD